MSLEGSSRCDHGRDGGRDARAAGRSFVTLGCERGTLMKSSISRAAVGSSLAEEPVRRARCRGVERGAAESSLLSTAAVLKRAWLRPSIAGSRRRHPLPPQDSLTRHPPPQLATAQSLPPERIQPDRPTRPRIAVGESIRCSVDRHQQIISTSPIAAPQLSSPAPRPAPRMLPRQLFSLSRKTLRAFDRRCVTHFTSRRDAVWRRCARIATRANPPKGGDAKSPV